MSFGDDTRFDDFNEQRNQVARKSSPIALALDDVAAMIGGGLSGHGVAEAIDPVAEDAFWRGELMGRPYYDSQFNFEQDYAPAFGFGYYLCSIFPSWTFQEAEDEFQRDWQRIKGESRLEWAQARGATQDAWDRYNELNATLDIEPDEADQQHLGQ